MSINVCIFSGNLTKDIEVRATKAGVPVGGFTIAINLRKKVNGEWITEPMFRECTLFGSRAEALARYLTKGAKVCVKGHEEERSWVDQETLGKRYKTVLMVEELEFIGGRREAKPAGDLLDGDIYASEDLPF